MSTKQDVGHFPPFRGEDQVEILQGVMEQEGAGGTLTKWVLLLLTMKNPPLGQLSLLSKDIISEM